MQSSPFLRYLLNTMFSNTLTLSNVNDQVGSENCLSHKISKPNIKQRDCHVKSSHTATILVLFGPYGKTLEVQGITYLERY